MILRKGIPMGKIIALGGGVFENGEVLPIIERIYEICGKSNPKVLYLPTAGFDDMDDAEIILKPFKIYSFYLLARASATYANASLHFSVT